MEVLDDDEDVVHQQHIGEMQDTNDIEEAKEMEVNEMGVKEEDPNLAGAEELGYDLGVHQCKDDIVNSRPCLNKPHMQSRKPASWRKKNCAELRSTHPPV